MQVFARTRGRARTAGTPSARHVAAGREARGQAAEIRHILGRGTVQPKLRIGAPNDAYEREADRVADQVMAMSAPKAVAGSEPAVRGRSRTGIAQRMCAECEAEEETVRRQVGGEEEEEELLQAKTRPGGARASGAEMAASAVVTGGRPLSVGERAYFEPRFGRDLSEVRVHDTPRAHTAASAINARAYTLGHDIAFAPGEHAPGTRAGDRLMAHELAHVTQQDADADDAKIQRELDPRSSLEFRPSTQGAPCACLVFIHNDERNARRVAEGLHGHCRYNLAIVGPGRVRTIPVAGAGRVDPNELFPQSIQEECTRDEAACRTYVADHDDLRAVQMQFFLAIEDCAERFTLPLIALHNNTIDDTAALRQSELGHELAVLMEDIERGTEEGRGSRSDLRQRLRTLGSGGGAGFEGLMTQGGTTNIFRWCNLPEITRCHIGDPFRPDHVIWVTNSRDFERLEQDNVNVVLQEGLETASGSESETDLSTLFVRLGPDVRYINIETPHARRGQLDDPDVRAANAMFILRNLQRVGLNCCDTE